MDAALDLLTERGVLAGLNLREVADRVGVTPANIYHLFGSRQGLLRAALDAGARADARRDRGRRTAAVRRAAGAHVRRHRRAPAPGADRAPRPRRRPGLHAAALHRGDPRAVPGKRSRRARSRRHRHRRRARVQPRDVDRGRDLRRRRPRANSRSPPKSCARACARCSNRCSTRSSALPRTLRTAPTHPVDTRTSPARAHSSPSALDATELLAEHDPCEQDGETRRE